MSIKLIRKLQEDISECEIKQLRLIDTLHSVYEEVAKSVTMEQLRPATASDIVEGAVLFGKGDYGMYCHTVDEVYYPSDDWKGYCADDGCRYGLWNTYVTKEKDTD